MPRRSSDRGRIRGFLDVLTGGTNDQCSWYSAPSLIHCEGGDLFLGELPVAIGRRHDLVRIILQNAVDDLTFIRITGDDGVHLQSTLAGIQSQLGLTLVLVRPVAEEAVLRENRANVAIELQLTGEHRRDPEKQCEIVDFEKDGLRIS